MIKVRLVILFNSGTQRVNFLCAMAKETLSKTKYPPVFDPEIDEYVNWKEDLEFWLQCTDLKVEKLGL